MKGIIFTELIELVEDKFGFDMVDNIIGDCDLPSGGVYTAVGSYPHTEVVDLVVALSKRTDIEVPDLLKIYGAHLFSRFTVLYPNFFEAPNETAFSFLEKIENYIHVEVRKLYPDAKPPRFETSRLSENTLEMIYHSSRHFEDVAEGLIQGCLDHFSENCEIQREPDEASEGIKFTITRAT